MPSLTLDMPWMQPAKSLVILPESTVSMQACSSSEAKRASSGLLSNLARCSRPRVHAKIEAIGLVEVERPFWCSLKSRKYKLCHYGCIHPSSTFLQEKSVPRGLKRNNKKVYGRKSLSAPRMNPVEPVMT